MDAFGVLDGFFASLLALLLILLASCSEPLPFLEAPATPRGHVDAVIAGDGTLIPSFLGRDSPVGVCLEIPAEVDSSLWEAELSFDGRPSPSGFTATAARMGRTLCFEAQVPEAQAPGDFELCGRLIDRYDQRQWRMPCLTAHFEPDRQPYQDKRQALNELLSAGSAEGIVALVAGLDRLGADSEAQFPFLAVRMQLIAAHYLTLEGTPAARSEARRRLEALPSWLAQPAASRYRAEAAYQRAVFYLYNEADLQLAWQQLSIADHAYLQIATGRRPAVVMLQARVLMRSGARREAWQRLRAALEDCQQAPCEAEIVAYTHGLLAWLILLDPEAAPAELAEAEVALERSLATLDASLHPIETANQLIDLSYLRVRQGVSPTAELQQARELLSSTRIAAEEIGWLRSWTELVEAMHHFEQGNLQRADQLCRELAHVSDRRLASWAWNCLGRIARAGGDLEQAAVLFEEALVRFEVAESPLFEQQPVLSELRSQAFLEAARAAIDIGEVEHAWQTLDRLDRLSAYEGQRRRCRERASDADLRARWQALDGEQAALFAELRELEAPAAGLRRRQLESRRRQVRQRLRELWLDWPGCGDREVAAPGGARYRAVALADEIVLLERTAAGATVVRRTPLARGELRRLGDRIRTAMFQRDLEDDDWRRLVAPVAAALVPPRQDLGAITTFALHGPLQDIPLAAMPLSSSAADWLGQATTIVQVPAGVGGVSSAFAPAAAEPFFAVDPRGDLPGARQLVDTYRQLFPEAALAIGSEVTAAALRRALAAAAWVHIDAHGLYEAAVPELSGLELSDRPIRLMELVELSTPCRLVNLSGCQTGRWPVTADSGHYGLGGLFTRLGVDWVIASRANLDDRAAHDFNLGFYRSLAAGKDIPTAYREAISHVSSSHSACVWGGILLLAAGEGGNSAAG